MCAAQKIKRFFCAARRAISADLRQITMMEQAFGGGRVRGLVGGLVKMSLTVLPK
jgi:hypothetical protein